MQSLVAYAWIDPGGDDSATLRRAIKPRDTPTTRRLRHLLRWPVQHHLALLRHLGAVGTGQDLAVVPVHDEGADAGLAHLADDAPDVGGDQRRQASVASSSTSSSGYVISARPMESICCSPPES